MRRIPESSLRRILITRTDRIGDVALSTPVFKAVREAFPGAYIGVIVLPHAREIVQGNPFINETIVYDKKGAQKNLFGNLLFAWKLRRGKWDAAVHLHPTHRMHWAAFLAGIPFRIGYDRKAGRLLTHRIEEKKREGEKHEAEYNFDLLDFLGVPKPGRLELFFPLNEENRIAFEKLSNSQGFHSYEKRYVVIHPSASSPSKIWPAERFSMLADVLYERYGLKCVLVGSQEDAPRAETVRNLMKHPAVNLSGKLSIGMLGWLLKRARLVISNDSGPVHIGVACGAPVLSIFGRNEPGLGPKRWGPLGEKSRYIQKDVGCFFCLADDCKIDFLCLRALKVEEVLDAVRGLEKFFLEPC